MNYSKIIININDLNKEILFQENIPEFTKLTTKIRNPEFEKKTQRIVSECFNGIIKYRDFISIFIINYYPNIVLNHKLTKYDHILLNKVKEVFNIYINIKTAESLECNIDTLQHRIKEFKSLFDNWKTIDNKEILDELVASYYELDSMYINIAYQDTNGQSLAEWRDKIQGQQKDILDNIKKISGEKGIKYLKEHQPMYINVKQLKDVATKAFWGTFEEQLKQDPPVYDRLVILLNELKQIIFTIIPSRHDLHEEINFKIDGDSIKNSLKHNALKPETIYEIMCYLVELIKKMQAAIHDKEMDEWWNNLQERMRNGAEYSEIIPIFLKDIFEKVETIKTEINEINENMNKNNQNEEKI